MQKKYLSLGLIVLILVVLATGFWKWQENRRMEEEKKQAVKQEEEKKEVTEIDMSDWKTYRNEEFGFEVKYPKDWEVCDRYDGITFSIIGTSEEIKKQGNITHDLESKGEKGDLVLNMWIEKNAKQEYSNLENWREYIIKNAINNNRNYYITNFPFSDDVLVVLDHKYGEDSLYITSYDFFYNNDGYNTSVFYSEKTNGIAKKILMTLKFDN